VKLQVTLDIPENSYATFSWACPFCPAERGLTFHDAYSLDNLMDRALDHISLEHSSSGGPSFS
jgi:hypothetical protein